VEKERRELVPFFLDVTSVGTTFSWTLSGDCQTVSPPHEFRVRLASFASILSCLFLKRKKFLLFVLLSVVSQPNDEEEKEEQYLLAMTVISSYPDGRRG